MSYIKMNCGICNKEYNGQISPMHIKSHGINTAEYTALYGAWRDPVLVLKCKESAQKGGGNEAARMALKAKSERARSEYNKNPRLCAYSKCGKPIPYELGYRLKCCTKECSYKLRTEKPLRDYANGKRIPNKCVQCSKELVGKNSKFCGGSCKAIHDTAILISQWMSGEIHGGTETKVNSRIRLYLIEQANHACTLCGWDKINPKTGNCPLHIDHVNGDCTDHRPKNLRVICPNCHSLTETYGALNRDNKGRTVRRKERLAHVSHDQTR
jgi:hypothetical protein